MESDKVLILDRLQNFGVEKIRKLRNDLTLYKGTVDRAYKLAEAQKHAAEENAREATRVAKTLIDTSQDEFVEMKIREGILKELGKGGKGKGSKGKKIRFHTLTWPTSLKIRGTKNLRKTER